MIKLMWGDASQKMAELINKSIKVDSIVTDPPYGVNFKSHYDDSKKYVFGNISQWYTGFYELLNEKGHMFVFVPTKEIHIWIQAGIDAGFNFKNIVNTKAHFIGGTFKPKNGFSYESQPILHFTKGVGKKFEEYDFIKTSTSWFKDKRNLNPKEYTYLYSNYIDKSTAFANTKSTVKNSKNTERHPNEKNTELLKFLIGISTKVGDTVLDPFMGSGSTGIASTDLNRSFIGIEKDEYWYHATKRKLFGFEVNKND